MGSGLPVVAIHGNGVDHRLLLSLDDALAALADEFGPCVAGHPVPMETTQLTAVCVLANDDAVTREGEPPSRLFVIGTGIRTDDGTRVVDMTIRSR